MLQLEHIHPMVVHFPIVLALLALAFDLWWLVRRKATATPLIHLRTGTVVLALGAAASVVAVLFGEIAHDIAVTKGVPDATMQTHEGWGTATMLVFLGVALVRLFLWWRRMDETRAGIATAIVLCAVVSLMVVITAYFGGHLVYDLGVNVGHGV